jgi:proline iminopeptidase
MKNIILVLFITTLFACKKTSITLGTNVTEVFFVKHKGASMPIRVMGNTASKTILLFIPGGPGGPGLVYRNTATLAIEKNYAVAYINQRECGESQGKSTEPNNMDLMTEDLDLMISAIKLRYGADVSVFILGHSFGGMSVSAYVTNGDKQKNIKGWIDTDGISDFPALGEMTRDMYLQYGTQEIALGKNVALWQPIVDWCNAHKGKLSVAEIQFINQQTDGEELMDAYIIGKDYFKSQTDYFLQLNKDYNFPLIPYGINFFSTANLNSPLSKDIETRSYNPLMNKVTIPSLFLVGKYDFICPPALHQQAYDNVATTEKKIVILPQSGHQAYFNEPELFAKEVNEFMAKYK